MKYMWEKEVTIRKIFKSLNILSKMLKIDNKINIIKDVLR